MRIRHTSQPAGLASSSAACCTALGRDASPVGRLAKRGVCSLSLVSRQRYGMIHEAKASSAAETAKPPPSQLQYPTKPATGAPITGAEALAMANPGLRKCRKLETPPLQR